MQSAAQQQQLTVWVCFRRITTADRSCMNWLSRWCASNPRGTNYCHVEIAIPVQCSQLDTCAYCQSAGARAVNGLHRLSYTISDVPTRDRVYFMCDRHYRREDWTIMTTQVLNTSQMSLFSTFLDKQRNKPFNRRGFYCNFLPCGGLCLSRGAHEKRDDQEEEDRTEWFCSELVLATLQRLAKFVDAWQPLCGQDPGWVGPNQLFAMLKDSQWSEVTNARSSLWTQDSGDEELPLLT